MKYFRITLFFLVAFSWFSTATIYAQTKFELSDCLVQTLNNSPKLRAEQLSQEKETAVMYEEKSNYLPQIDAFLTYSNYFDQLPTYIFPQKEGSNLAGEQLNGPYPVQLGLPHNLNTGFEISQTIFDMNFFGNGIINQHYSSYKNIRLSIAEEEILYQVAVLFYQIAVNEERLKFLNLNLERLKKLQGIVGLQVEQGFAKPTDLDKLLVKTSNLNSKKNKLKGGIQQQVRYLKLMMGLEQEEEIEIEYDEEIGFDPGIGTYETGELLEEQMMEEQRELNKMNTKKINANYYPKIQAYAAFLFQAQRQQFNFFEGNQDWYNQHQWGIKLTVPVLHGFAKKNKKQISEIVDAQLSFGIEQKQEQNLVEFQSAIVELEVARQEQSSQQENVALAERVFTQSELSYEQGTILLMDFLDSEATLREAKMMYATALLDTRIAELKILKASGNLKELVNQ